MFILYYVGKHKKIIALAWSEQKTAIFSIAWHDISNSFINILWMNCYVPIFKSIFGYQYTIDEIQIISFTNCRKYFDCDDSIDQVESNLPNDDQKRPHWSIFGVVFSYLHFFRMNLADKPARIPSSIDTVGISLHPYFECHRMDIQLIHRACLVLETVP